MKGRIPKKVTKKQKRRSLVKDFSIGTGMRISFRDPRNLVLPSRSADGIFRPYQGDSAGKAKACQGI
jgi:hypothetical protein